jgi:hypothetical protein
MGIERFSILSGPAGWLHSTAYRSVPAIFFPSSFSFLFPFLPSFPPPPWPPPTAPKAPDFFRVCGLVMVTHRYSGWDGLKRAYLYPE